MAPITMKTKTAGPISPGTSSTGGIRDVGAAKREATREKYFKGREDVSADRLERRQKQADEYEKFKQTQMKLVPGSTNLYQSVTPGGPTLADKANQLAYKYGPTFSEIGGDIAYGAGKTFSALAEAAMSGKIGLTAIFTGLVDKFNKSYDKMNDVAKEIFENKDRYSYASKMPSVRDAEDASMKLLQAQENLNRYNERKLFQDYKSRFMDPAMAAETDPTVDMGGGITTLEQVSPLVTETRQPISPMIELKQSAIDRFSPEYLEEQKKLLEEFNKISPVEELQLDDQASLSTADGTQVTAFNNPVNLQFAGQPAAIEGQTYGNNFAVFPDAESGVAAAKADLASKVNRFGGDVEQIIGQFAPREDNPDSFDNYVNFVKAGVGDTVEPNEINELTKRVIQFENKPEIANQYLNVLGGSSTLLADASKADIQTLKPIRDMGIGYDMGVDMFSPVIRDLKEKNPTLTDEEIRGIIEGTITKPTGVYAADGGMIDKQLKSLQNGLQNMYNGIPSVRRR